MIRDDSLTHKDDVLRPPSIETGVPLSSDVGVVTDESVESAIGSRDRGNTAFTR